MKWCISLIAYSVHLKDYYIFGAWSCLLESVINVDETSVVEREMDGKEKLPAPFPYISHNVILSEPIN